MLIKYYFTSEFEGFFQVLSPTLCIYFKIQSLFYLLIPRLCFFIVLKLDLFVYRDDSLTS